jgi:hypothetical protein
MLNLSLGLVKSSCFWLKQALSVVFIGQILNSLHPACLTPIRLTTIIQSGHIAGAWKR